MPSSFSTLTFESLLRTFVWVFPSSDLLHSDEADVAAMWRRMDITSARASDSQMPFNLRICADLTAIVRPLFKGIALFDPLRNCLDLSLYEDPGVHLFM